MKDCPRCGALITDRGAVLCHACASEQVPPAPAGGPPCPRCGRATLSDADLSLLAAGAYDACYRASTIIAPVIKDNLRAIVKGLECRAGNCEARRA